MNRHDCQRDTDPAPPVETSELEVRVRCRIRGYVRDFRLVAACNGLILRGSAHSYYGKQLAQQAVMGAAPFRILANEIEVLSPPDGGNGCEGGAAGSRGSNGLGRD